MKKLRHRDIVYSDIRHTINGRAKIHTQEFCVLNYHVVLSIIQKLPKFLVARERCRLENHSSHKAGLNYKDEFKNKIRPGISLGGLVLSLLPLPLLWGVLLFFQQSLI